MKSKGLGIKIIICVLLAVVLVSLVVLPIKDRCCANVNLFQILFSNSSMPDAHADGIELIAMGFSLSSQDNDYEKYFVLSTIISFYIFVLDNTLYLTLHLLLFLYFLILKSCKFISRVMSGPLGGNSPPYILSSII